jgi:hypothetical protein
MPGQQSQFGQQPQTQVGQQPQAQVGQQPQTQVGQIARKAVSPSVQQFEKTLPSEFRVALHDVNTLAEVADWCRDRCLDQRPQVANVSRALEDLRDVAELNEKFITHDSAYGPHVAEALLRIAQQSLPELQQYQQDPAVADTIPVVERAVESTEKLLRSVGWQTGQQSQVGQQKQTQRFGQQPGKQRQSPQVSQQRQSPQVGQQGQSSQVGQQQKYGQVGQQF